MGQEIRVFVGRCVFTSPPRFPNLLFAGGGGSFAHFGANEALDNMDNFEWEIDRDYEWDTRGRLGGAEFILSSRPLIIFLKQELKSWPLC